MAKLPGFFFNQFAVLMIDYSAERPSLIGDSFMKTKQWLHSRWCYPLCYSEFRKKIIFWCSKYNGTKILSFIGAHRSHE